MNNKFPHSYTYNFALLFMLVCFCTSLQSAYAAEKATTANSEEMLDISADESLEWYKEKNLYVARGNAKATRGKMTIEADVLAAHEREKTQTEQKTQASQNAKTIKNPHTLELPTKSENSDFVPSPSPMAEANNPLADNKSGNFDKLTAEGHVHLYDDKQQVWGDKAEYDADLRIARVTGSNLKYISGQETVTARDSLEYNQDKQQAIARGNAVAIRNTQKVTADILTANFKEDASGQSQLSIIKAEGNVVVYTQTDVARGEKAVYDARANIAVLTGHVRVTRADGTQLSGDVATVDMTSGESRMNNTGGGRVRALLPSNAGKKKDSPTFLQNGANK